MATSYSFESMSPLNYVVHGTVPLFSFFALSFGLLRFLRTFVSLFL